MSKAVLSKQAAVLQEVKKRTPSKVRAIVDKLVHYFKLMIWILSSAQKPTRDQLRTSSRMTLIMILAVGTYAFVFSLLRYVVFGGHFVSLPYPYNFVLVGVTAGALVGLGVYLYWSIGKAVKSRKGK